MREVRIVKMVSKLGENLADTALPNLCACLVLCESAPSFRYCTLFAKLFDYLAWTINAARPNAFSQ